MSEETKIEWCDFTYNLWIGCTKVSEGCRNCYAESLDKRRKWTAEGWGQGAPRRRTSEAVLKKVLIWERKARQGQFVECKCGWRGFTVLGRCQSPECSAVMTNGATRPRVFSASLSDWLDSEVPIEWFIDLMGLIAKTPNLDWLLLTKRPEKFRARIEQALGYIEYELEGDYRLSFPLLKAWSRGESPVNVWVGTSVENQKQGELRCPQLLEIPAKIHFLSCEPLLGPVDLEPLISGCPERINWVIAGGESGPGARPMEVAWARGLRKSCEALQIPFLFKQWGAHDAEGVRVGKSKAGRLLEGRFFNEFPSVERGGRDAS